jgi:integrase
MFGLGGIENMGRKKEITTWAGGRVRGGIYYVRKMVVGPDGRRHRVDFSTHCTDPKAAQDVLEKWERDASYRPNLDQDRFDAAVAGSTKLALTDALRDEFLAWSVKPVQEGGRGNTEKWAYDQKRCLKWWQEKCFKDRDVRKVSVQEVRAAWESIPEARQQRIAVLKAFFTWLRRHKHLLNIAQDPTQDIAVPASTPAQYSRDRTYTKEQYRKLIGSGFLSEDMRDAAVIQFNTGWHCTELKRWIDAGQIADYRGDRKNTLEAEAACVLACPRAKNGKPLNTTVNATAQAAAKRLLARRPEGYRFNYKRYLKELKRVSEGLKLPRFYPGQARHSAATWAVDAGASMQEVADFLNHSSIAMVRKYYATHASAKKIPTVDDGATLDESREAIENDPTVLAGRKALEKMLANRKKKPAPVEVKPYSSPVVRD